MCEFFALEHFGVELAVVNENFGTTLDDPFERFALISEPANGCR